MAADGSIVIVADIDDKKAQAELNRLSRKIQNINDQIEGKTRKRSYYEAQAEQLRQAYDTAIANDQDDLAQNLAKQYDKVQAAITRINEQLRLHNIDLGLAQEKAGVYAAQLSSVGEAGVTSGEETSFAMEDAEGAIEEVGEAGEEAGEKTAEGFDFANTAAGRLERRIVGLIRRVFIFSVITSALRGLRAWLVEVVKSDNEAAAAMAQLKGALLTLAQPLVEVIIPAFVMLINVLSRVIMAIATFVSYISGKSLKQSADSAKALYEEQNAIEGVGGAAKEASKSLAAFDEINQLSDDSGSGGGGGAGAETMPDFSGITDEITPRLKEILDYVLLIGAGLALWKIASYLPGILGMIATKLAGIMITIGGLLLLWDGLQDAWNNGVNWGNLIEMIAGLAAAMIGLYIAFGPVAAGIMGVVGGIALLVTAFHDAMENGWNLQNTLLAIAGIIATGLGIALLTGSWIPLLIAGIAAVLLALTIATGHGEELLDGVRLMLEGFKDFFVGIFTGDIERAIGGIEKIFEGLKIAVFAVFDGMQDAIISFLDWLDEKTHGKFSGIIQFIKDFVVATFSSVKQMTGEVIDAIKQIFVGLTEFIAGVFTADWDKAWQGIKNIFKGIFNGIVAILEGAINLIIDGINWLIEKANTLSIDIPDIFGGGTIGIDISTIPRLQIPRLAQGAVIPPNREFLAVLGDQSSGNNIEAPESLLRQMAQEAASANTALLEQILQAIRDGKVIAVDRTILGKTAKNSMYDLARMGY